jgi:hypothetical protein
MKKVNPEFDVALSFAGEDRTYVEAVADVIRQMGLRVFYDKYEAISLWGKDLYTHLQEIYFNRARYTVIFISKHYKKKLWTNHERESAQARAFQEHKEYLLPVRFDNTQIPGILPTTGYINLNKISPENLAEMIKQKIGHIDRPNFFPHNPDRLNTELKIARKAKTERKIIYSIAHSFFESLKLMTPFERQILAEAVINTCPAGPPKNVHLVLSYLSRLTSLPPKELTSLFSRLDCLHIKTKVKNSKEHASRGKLAKPAKIIEITYEAAILDFFGNATDVMVAVFNCIFNNLCPNCARRAIEIADLSILSTLAGFAEVNAEKTCVLSGKPASCGELTHKSTKRKEAKRKKGK